MSIEKQASRGLAWTGAAKGFTQIIGAVVTLALARLLTPVDFGLVAMVMVFTGFLSAFGDMGFAASLIQHERVEERHRSSVFWLNLGVGSSLAALLALSAPAVADFYRDGRLSWIVRVLALEFLIMPFAMVQHALLSRALRFRALAAVEAASMVTSSAVALALAVGGFGAWALVARSLAGKVAALVTLFALSGWRPRWMLDRGALRELWGFSANLFGHSVVAYWTSRADDFLVGRVFGARSLGLYGRAYSTMMLPVTEIANVLGRVMFPALSKLKDDPDEVKRIYLRLVAIIGLFTFPVMLALSAMSNVFITVLFGEQWVGAAPVLAIYGIAGVSQVIGFTTTWIFTSRGRTDLLFRWTLVDGAVLVGSIALGVRLGSIEAVAVCYTVATVLLLTYPRIAIPGRLIGLVPLEVWRALRGSLACAVVMAGLLWLVGRYSTSRLPPVGDFALRAVLGVAIYAVLARVFAVHGLTEFRHGLRTAIGARSPLR